MLSPIGYGFPRCHESDLYFAQRFQPHNPETIALARILADELGWTPLGKNMPTNAAALIIAAVRSMRSLSLSAANPSNFEACRIGEDIWHPGDTRSRMANQKVLLVVMHVWDCARGYVWSLLKFRSLARGRLALDSGGERIHPLLDKIRRWLLSCHLELTRLRQVLWYILVHA